MEDFLNLFLGLILGALLMYWFWKSKGKSQTEKQSVILLEKIKSVCRLITVEGDFAEVYHYENEKDGLLSLLSTKKKAIVLVNAKVHIGYDLKKVQMRTDIKNRKIIISNFPQPEVLTIEPELQYYDIKDGFLNKFDAGDLTKLNSEAKTHIRDKIPESGLMVTAKKEALEAVLIIEKIVETINWKLDYSALEIATDIIPLEEKND